MATLMMLLQYGADDFSQIGVVVERCDSEEVEIEIFPDRPDLLSHETMARAARSFPRLRRLVHYK